MIANLEALFIIWRSRLGRLHDEMLFARLEPLTFDACDLESFVFPHKRYRPVGVAVAGMAGDFDWVGTIYGHHTGSVSI